MRKREVYFTNARVGSPSMKYCPSCDLKFDDDVMRFCTKDGTPLIDEREPNFVEMPSEQVEETAAAAPIVGSDEPDEVTIVRRNVPVPAGIEVPPPPSEDDDFSDVVERPADRIVVPMTPEPAVDPLRNRNAAVYYQQPKQHTGLIVVLTILLTVTVLGAGAGLFWLLQKTRGGSAANNANLNANQNVNTNTGFDTNFNFNTNPSITMPTPVNLDLNTNTKTPTPTPSASPTPTPTPKPSATPTPNEEVIEPATPRPTATPFDGRPRVTPTPQPTQPTMRSTPRSTPHTFATP